MRWTDKLFKKKPEPEIYIPKKLLRALEATYSEISEEAFFEEVDNNKTKYNHYSASLYAHGKAISFLENLYFGSQKAENYFCELTRFHEGDLNHDDFAKHVSNFIKIKNRENKKLTTRLMDEINNKKSAVLQR